MECDIYRLPNGKTTKSENRYLKAWGYIRKDLESRGLVLHSFDPTISFCNVVKGVLSTPFYLSVEVYSKLTGIDFKNRDY